MKKHPLMVSACTVGLAMALTATAATTQATAAESPERATSAPAPIAPRIATPPGWSVSEDAGTTRITWKSTAAIPLADAPLQFWIGQQLLGTPQPLANGRTFTLDLSEPLPGRGGDLRVTVGGQPVDGAGQRIQPQTTSTEPNFRTPTQTAENAPQPATDPGVPGQYSTRTSEYALDGVPLTGLPYDVEVQGVVVRPTNITGPRPLVLFLHGRHSTCYRGGPDGRSSGAWPCPDNWQSIPSYRGYLDAQELLASQGYVTVSISANGINGQDFRANDGGAQARSELVRHHLDLFDQWNSGGGDPFGTSLIGRVDLDRVMLVGHSRGGEGVNRAAVDTTTADPWRIDSQVLIGPTSFGRQTAPGVDTAVLLPFCDGDVSDLQGQQYIDQARDLSTTAPDPALRSSVLVMGANHNYFNAEWTPGVAVAPAWDDWGGRTGPCGKKTETRLTAKEQRNVGAVYVAGAASAFIKNSRDALTLFDGSDVRPASIGDAVTDIAALGANRTTLTTFRAGTDMRTVNAFALICRGYAISRNQPTCAPGVSSYAQPHFLRMYGASDAPPTRALRMRWRQAGAHVKVSLPTPVDLSQSSSLDLRVAAHPDSTKSTMNVVIGDGGGNVARLGSQTLYPLPGDRGLSKLLAQTMRLPIDQSSSIDLTDVQWIRLTGESRQGRVVVLDAYGHTPGVLQAPRPTLPRVDVSDVSVQEGDDGRHFENVVLNISGSVTGGERFYVENNGYERRADDIKTIVRLTPGQTTAVVPVAVSGDTRDDYRQRSQLTVKALSGITTGDYSGLVSVRDDDPTPQVIIERPARTSVEGGTLTWRIKLDAPSDKYIELEVRPAPAGDTELTLADLPRRFLRQHGLASADSDLTLSDSRLRLFTFIRSGRTAAEFLVPVRDDGVAEGEETVLLRQRRGDVTLPTDLSGTVTDAT